MKTEVILKRAFMGSEISQKSKSGMFNATDLVKIANIKRKEIGQSQFNLSQFLRQKSTLEFIDELQLYNERVIISGRGRNAFTWVHPLLFIDIALAINPKFKVEVYKWLYDELLLHRNNSGESYKKMAGAIFDRMSNKADFHKYIVRVANYIKEKCNVKDWNNASESELKLRDKMHDNIYLLCSVLNNTNEAIRIGVMKAKEDLK